MLLTGALPGCLSTSGQSGARKSSEVAVTNSTMSVPEGYGRLLQDNPIILSGNVNLDGTADLSRYLKTTPDFITYNNSLMESCLGSGNQGNIESCYEVRKDRNTSLPLTAVSKRWAFPVTTSEFAQVNAFGHIKKYLDRYHNLIRDIYTTKAVPNNAPPFNFYETAIPRALYSTTAQWYGGQSLVTYADCDLPGNANFNPSDFTLCFGSIPEFANVKMAQDPSVMHHELGHALSQMMMNFRNIAGGIVDRSNISYTFYDEAGAIQEGVADYYAYAMNGRSRFGEWGLIRFGNAGRPNDENDSMHAPGISRNVEERLRYPDYLSYDSTDPTATIEDVHYAGQIASHFLTAFTRDLQESCAMSFTQATDTVLYLLTETYAELGDLTSSASDHSAGVGLSEPTINHRSDLDASGIKISKEWLMKVTPINYRSFFQKFAKYAYQILNKNFSTRCNGTNYPLDNLEKLLDSYGLLLFKTYNENGNNYTNGNSGTNKTVTAANRLKSVLISKNLIKLDPATDSSPFFVFDKRTDLIAAIASLQARGNITQISSQIPAQLDYNNGNGEISPGEVVGIALNLYNDSNSTMAGVEVLANDWDHIKDDAGVPKPCNTFEDAWPLSTEGAAPADPVASSFGQCQYVTRMNGTAGGAAQSEPGEYLHPVCFVQVKDGGTTKWATQDALRISQNGDPNKCLGGTGNRKDCYFRAIRGADFAWYSKINPKMSWGKSVPDETGSPNFNSNNILLFEASPDIPPGTVFDCRFRVRFTNCTECFTKQSDVNGDDWLDFEYSGPQPFKIIHFQFTVID
ncbi:MAG: hypothetical protein A2X86_01680 [Bdellovibrionales bacterium GWA2_49_15]|nr:MAG: hypothetical protein A2X86_01680 [Bdellovibrionales bacterium GWA2_49_15]